MGGGITASLGSLRSILGAGGQKAAQGEDQDSTQQDLAVQSLPQEIRTHENKSHYKEQPFVQLLSMFSLQYFLFLYYIKYIRIKNPLGRTYSINTL